MSYRNYYNRLALNLKELFYIPIDWGETPGGELGIGFGKVAAAKKAGIGGEGRGVGGC
jgi:hypothetical protein